MTERKKPPPGYTVYRQSSDYLYGWTWKRSDYDPADLNYQSGSERKGRGYQTRRSATEAAWESYEGREYKPPIGMGDPHGSDKKLILWTTNSRTGKPRKVETFSYPGITDPDGPRFEWAEDEGWPGSGEFGGRRLKFVDWLEDKLGTRKWVVSQRLTPRLRTKGYDLAISNKKMRELEAEFEVVTKSEPAGQLPGTGSAWSKLAPEHRSERVGWSNQGEFYCPNCSTIIGKNLKGDQPYDLVVQHLQKHIAEGCFRGVEDPEDGLDAFDGGVTVKGLMEAFPKLEYSDARRLLDLIDKVNSDRDVEHVMEIANEILGGYGVEGLSDERAHRDSFWQDAIASYVNLGDPYVTTIIYDTENSTFLIGTWGDFLENWELELEADEGDEDEEDEEEDSEDLGGVERDPYAMKHLNTWLDHEIDGDDHREKVKACMLKMFDEDPEYWSGQSWWNLYDRAGCQKFDR